MNVVPYKVSKWKKQLCSACELFTSKDIAFVPIGRVVKTGGMRAVREYYENLGSEYVDALNDMIVLDAVIYNTDRHFGNFGVLRDNHTGKVLGAAPIFDNGLSLFNFAMQNDIDHLDEYAKTRANPYGIPYETVCREIMGNKQRAQLHRLINFRFSRHPAYNWPEERLKPIEDHIQQRVRELLALPRK